MNHAAESVRDLVTKSKTYKLFGTKISVITSTSQKSHCTLDNAGLYWMTPDQNEKENEEPMVAIEEKDLILVSAQKEERGCQP